MKRVLILLLLSVMLTGCSEGWLPFGKSKPKAPVSAENISGNLLVSVGERVITLEDFNDRIKALNSEIEAAKDVSDSVKETYLIETAEAKQRHLEGIIERELLIVEAIDRGLEQDEEVAKVIKALTDQLLFARIIDVEREKITIGTKDVENFYNLNKDLFKISEERKISLIVVAGEAQAKELLIQLLQGADFGTLARTHSSDPSASSGGNMGFIVKKSPFPQPDKKTMFEKFEQVAFTMELNKPSTIFQGSDGFYIIKVTEIKEARQTLLSEAYKDIEQYLLLQKHDAALKTLVGNLRKATSIVTHEELLRD